MSDNNMGWECPKCGKVYSPEMKECNSCNYAFRQIPPTWTPSTPDDSGKYPEWYKSQDSGKVPCFGRAITLDITC